jgi:hypothetical protein
MKFPHILMNLTIESLPTSQPDHLILNFSSTALFLLSRRVLHLSHTLHLQDCRLLEVVLIIADSIGALTRRC